MKLLIPVLALATLTACVLAEGIESVPQEKTVNIARELTLALGAPGDVPIGTEVDVEKAVAIKAGPAGLLAMPDKKLTADALASAQETIVLGQLWMHNIVPAVEKSAPSPDKLRSVTVNSGDDNPKAEVYFLSAARSATGALELNLFSKDKTALVKVPLVKTDAAVNATPIALAGHKDDDNTGTLVITIFGSYKADVTVTRPRE